MTGESSNADSIKSTERRGSGQAVTDGSQQTTGNVTSAQLAAAIDAHESASNPHPAYLTQPEGDARYIDQGAATPASPVGNDTLIRVTVDGQQYDLLARLVP